LWYEAQSHQTFIHDEKKNKRKVENKRAKSHKKSKLCENFFPSYFLVLWSKAHRGS
jgi:hypothetical protein